MAPAVGLEPTTPLLTIKCYNQLSYAGKNNIQRESLATTYSRTIKSTTISVKVLNFCVRDGNRCDHFAIITRLFSLKTR